MTVYLKEQEVKDILAQRWTLDCPRMKLVKQNSGEVTFEGAGAIRFGEDGRLEYVLYDTTTEVSADLIFRGLTLPAGEWLSPDHFHTLRATDFHDRTWTAEWLDADSSSRSGVPGAVVRGRVSELRSEPNERQLLKSISLFARTSRNIPTNALTTVRKNVAGSESESFDRNVWQTDTSIGRLQAVRDGDVLHVLLRSDHPVIPQDAALRLEEALSVITGEQVRWSVEQEGSPNGTIIIRDIRESFRRPRLRPPIEYASLADVQDVGVLFDCILAHLIRTRPRRDERHPLAIAVMNVLRASAAMLEDEALAVSVQVEGVVRSQFTDAGKPRAETAALVEKMQTHVQQWDGDETFKARVLNLVGNMKGANAESALKALAATGLIEERHWRAWRALRHPSAHGTVRQAEVRLTVAQCDLVFDLLLRMIFGIIGYTGHYSDHTQSGWPLRKVPPFVVPTSTDKPASSQQVVVSPDQGPTVGDAAPDVDQREAPDGGSPDSESTGG